MCFCAVPYTNSNCACLYKWSEPGERSIVYPWCANHAQMLFTCPAAEQIDAILILEPIVYDGKLLQPTLLLPLLLPSSSSSSSFSYQFEANKIIYSSIFLFCNLHTCWVTHKKGEEKGRGKERRSGEFMQARQSNKTNRFTFTNRTFLNFFLVRFLICFQEFGQIWGKILKRKTILTREKLVLLKNPFSFGRL